METFYYHTNPSEYDGVRMTFVGKYNEEDGTLGVTASRCAANDHFRKAKGRDLADERYDACGALMVVKTPAETSLNTFNRVAKMLAAGIALNPSVLPSCR